MATKRARILIIDDEEGFCNAVRINLQEVGGYEVAVATNGRIGLKAARLGQPDLILLDIVMPGMDGFEVLKRLKGSGKTAAIPVLMLTAKRDQESKQKTTSLYDEGYIEKPVEAEVLRSKVEEVLLRAGMRSGTV